MAPTKISIDRLNEIYEKGRGTGLVERRAGRVRRRRRRRVRPVVAGGRRVAAVGGVRLFFDGLDGRTASLRRRRRDAAAAGRCRRGVPLAQAGTQRAGAVLEHVRLQSFHLRKGLRPKKKQQQTNKTNQINFLEKKTFIQQQKKKPFHHNGKRIWYVMYVSGSLSFFFKENDSKETKKKRLRTDATIVKSWCGSTFEN